jgi:hypothetical protein
MSLQAVHLPQPLPIVPPLLPPLVLRTQNGFLGAKRLGPGEFDSPDPYGIPPYEPTTEHERGLAAVFGRALELADRSRSSTATRRSSAPTGSR